MIKLKIGGGTKALAPDTQTPQQDTAPSPATTATPAPPKLKLNFSQPPTPIEQPGPVIFPPSADPPAEKKKRPYQKKQDGTPGTGKGKKRAADDDNMPLAKRIASGSGPGPARKLSIKIGPATPQLAESAVTAVLPRLTLKQQRKQSVPRLVDLRARGKAPPRPKGVGYDSEDSDVETDPAIQQAFVLRMQEGEDAEYLRQAIAEGKIGPHASQGDAEVSLKFVEKNYRRAVVKVHGRMYAAALVDLPCIVESMKSFDKKGWWKVADIAQMLLVLGRCSNEDEAKTYRLPREVNKDNYQYAHGLTPPMHRVRKRRFRKRMNYTDVLNVEEEVERLLQADRDWEAGGGRVFNDQDHRQEFEPAAQQQDYEFEDEDADGEAIETVETDGQEYEGDEMEEDVQDDDLAAQMQAMFDEEDAEASALIAESPAPIVDQAASMAAVESAIDDSEATPVGTPADTAATPQDEQSSDEDESDEDEDEDSPDAFDEDAAAKAAERAQQLEEVADLEREVERARQKAHAMTNQLLRQRELAKLAALEQDLRVKRDVFGLSGDDD